jgi:NADH-quinone oxidoreductase subunit G
MPKLIIDNIPVEVPPGTSVLEAARSVGITIPHFCYHPALAIAAACRLCAVKLLEGPVKGIQMSCSLPAQDGMVVSTTDPEALKLRSLVIEWLMINHPHDCPVCDEGGECLLQDFTVAGGHGRRRYQGKKRTHRNQYLGEGIEHEMNRCIQCYRCVRFYQDYAGGTDFGVTGSAGRVYFGRFEDGALESPFSGNLVDICPTGVFTDKTGRFRARYWDYQFSPSICQKCSVGCNTAPQAYHRELIKVVARRNDHVNGWFICDRGRFDKKAVNDPERPREPKVDGTPCDFETALDALAARMRDFIEVNGPGSLALVGSSRLSLEGCIMLGEIARNLDGAALCYFASKAEAQGSLAAVELLNDGNAASLLDLQGADCIVLFSLDLMEEGPMLAPAIRKASLAGAKVYHLAPSLTGKKPGTLPFQCTVAHRLEDVPLQDASKAVIVCGSGVSDPALLARLAATGAKLALLQPGANGFGAALLAREHGAVSLSEALAAKKVKGIICFEPELPAGLPAGIATLACADWCRSEAAEAATIFLPTTTWIESEGTSVNFEGRAQRFRRAMHAGLPLRGLEAKYYSHTKDGMPAPCAGPCQAEPYPPRVHRGPIPGGQEQEAWKVMARLLEKLGGERIDQPLLGKWAKLKDLDPEGGGQRILGW